MTATSTENPTAYEGLTTVDGDDIQLELDGAIIALSVNDETAGLSIEDAEALIAKLAVKVAQARMAG